MVVSSSLAIRKCQNCRYVQFKHTNKLETNSDTISPSGIEADLGMTGLDFERALTVFYVFVRTRNQLASRKIIHLVILQYLCFDIPSNLALKHFGSVWLACTVISFGVITLATAFVKSYRGFLAIRMFLGLSEGGTVVSFNILTAFFFLTSESLSIVRLGLRVV